MSWLENSYLVGTGAFGAGLLAGYWLLRWKERNVREAILIKERGILANAERQAETVLREARLKANEEALKLREETERSFASRREELNNIEKRLVEREALINHELGSMMEEEKALREQQAAWHQKHQELESRRADLEALVRQRREELQATAKLTESEARAQLLKEVEAEALHDASHLTRRILEEARSRAEEKARHIIALAIQRYAGEHTFETTSATVALPGEELKGRIIGREGRNIRAFENATGVTVLIDDTPNAVVLSGFDPVRREVARESMQRLLLDGRIHPTRIEEVVAKVTQEMDEAVIRAGEDAVNRAGLPPMHPEIVKHLGRLRFRQSFCQNVLAHSIEVAHLTGLMAAELGLDAATARRAGLLHDIGKALNHEVEGAHALVGADLVRRCGESPEVVNAVASHHDEVPHEGPLGILVGAADAISASRPGARSETMTTYLKRVEDLEKLGASFAGVEKCFAVQAGRELRVLVQPDQINDDQAFALARNICRKIEDEMQYPGQIRVTVVRERRCVEFAK
ncbi:MAG TPA: ribonuclease Y [Methylomirabilota bacterium]|nr:ribonuclease Y [Methylomirabilota bacterium]